MDGTVTYEGPHSSVTVVLADGSSVGCTRGQTITLDIDVCAALLHEGGWVAGDEATAAYTPVPLVYYPALTLGLSDSPLEVDSATLATAAKQDELKATLIGGNAQVDAVRPSTAATSSVAASSTSITVLAPNAGRKGAAIFNDGAGNLYVKLGATATLANFSYKIPAGGTLELPSPSYSGRIDGIWDVASGAARVTEVTA